MKNLLFLTLLFLFIQTNYAQEKENLPNQNSIYSIANLDVKPEFPGGYIEFGKYIANNYIIPLKLRKTSGKIYLNFYVEIDGSLTDIKVARDIGFGSGEEAIRILKDSPKWSPGQIKGVKVKTLLSLPISIN